MAQAITTSIVIDFSNDSENSGVLKVEVDSDASGYNNGVTSFKPGDSPVLLMYKTSNVKILQIASSYGTVSSFASGKRAKREFVTFAGAKEASPSYPISSGFSSKWVGKSGGTVTQEQNSLSLNSLFTGVLLIEYNTDFTALRLKDVPKSLDGETSFPIVVFIQGEVP